MQTTFRKLPMAWPLVIFLLSPALTRAETGVQAWVRRYNGPGSSYSNSAQATVIPVTKTKRAIHTAKTLVRI